MKEDRTDAHDMQLMQTLQHHKKPKHNFLPVPTKTAQNRKNYSEQTDKFLSAVLLATTNGEVLRLIIFHELQDVGLAEIEIA